MPRYSSKTGEVPATKGASKKYEVEAGKLPKKPRGGSGTDGLYTGRSRPKEMVAKDAHAPQDDVEKRAKSYDNDTKTWARGGDAGGNGRPGFDNGKLDECSKPAKPATGLKATGQDLNKSPFSKAHRRGLGEGF